MKKLSLLLISILSLTFILSGCYFLDLGELNWEEQSIKMVEAFDNHDLKSAVNLFNVDTRNKSNLKKQLKKAFEFYNSKSTDINYNEVSSASQNDDISYDRENFEVIVKTKSKTFTFYIEMFTYHSDKNLVGIIDLTVSEKGSDKYVSVGC